MTAQPTTDLWHDVALVRATMNDAENVHSRVIGKFDARNEAHASTLLALEPRERRALFTLSTHRNWGTRGVAHGALAVADGWMRVGRFVEALVLFDDLVATRHLSAQTYDLALWAVQNDNNKLGVDPVRARTYLARALRHGPVRPSIFHNAICVLAELGDVDGCVEQLRRAARHGYDLDKIASEPTLASVLADPRCREVLARAPARRGVLRLAEKLGEIDPPRVEPPSARRVAARALVLAALSWRASLPGARPTALADERARAEGDVAELRGWLAARGLDRELDAEEAAFLASPVETGMTPECVDRSWLVEGAAILAWALRLRPLPQYDQKVDPDRVRADLGLLDARADALLAKPALRPIAELRTFRTRVLALHWRLVAVRVRRGPIDFDALARAEPGLESLDLGYVKLNDGDLDVGGRPIASAKPGAADRIASLALERHRAADWLCGHPSAIWSEVDADA